MSLVLGIDGARAGWVAVALEGGRFAGCHLAPTLAELTAWRPEAGALAIDVPIGLPDYGPREADAAARALLGPRRSSVFDVPPRPVLTAGDYAEANALSRALTGRGLSRQSYALRAKILEAEALAADPRVHEVHPGAELPHDEGRGPRELEEDLERPSGAPEPAGGGRHPAAGSLGLRRGRGGRRPRCRGRRLERGAHPAR